MSRGRKALSVGLLTFTLLLMLAIGAVWAFQRSLIFPAPQHADPLPDGFAEVRLHTDDGLTLKAAWRAGAPDKPTIVFFHGNGDSWTGAARATELLAAAGYGVLLPEYRGYAGNPGSPSEPGLYRDGRAALRWLADTGVAPGRTILIGNSIGSGVATRMAAEFRPAALVLISPFSSLDAVVSEKFPFLPVRLLLRDRFDNLGSLAGARYPVLLLHGTDDTLIPATHSQTLAAATPQSELRLVARSGHELAYTPAAQQMVVEWLERAVSRMPATIRQAPNSPATPPPAAARPHP